MGADQTAAMLSDEGARLKAAARTADADATAARAEAAQVDGSTPKSTLGIPQGLVPLEYLGVTVCTPECPGSTRSVYVLFPLTGLHYL